MGRAFLAAILATLVTACGLILGADFGDKTVLGATDALALGDGPKPMGQPELIGKAQTASCKGVPARVAAAAGYVYAVCYGSAGDIARSSYGSLLSAPASGGGFQTVAGFPDAFTVAVVADAAFLIGGVPSLQTSGVARIADGTPLTIWERGLFTGSTAYGTTLLFAGVGGDGVVSFDVSVACPKDDAGIVGNCTKLINRTGDAMGIAVSGGKAFVYVCPVFDSRHWIYSAALDGSQAMASPTPLFDTGAQYPTKCPAGLVPSLGLAATAQRLFFALDNEVRVCAADGSPCGAATFAKEAGPVALVTTDGVNVYWTVGSTLRGASPMGAAVTVAGAPASITALFVGGGYAYWGDVNGNVYRVQV